MSRARADARRADRLVQLAWIAIGVYAVALGIAAVLRAQGDFNVYYRAGARVLSGEAIYRLDESSHFLYAPIIAIAFAPFAALPLQAAQFAFFLISGISLIALIPGAARMLFGRAHRLTPLLIVLPVIVCARFIDNNIEHGQINLPTVALTIWAIVLAEEDRAIAAGAMLALAILIKPFAGLAALFLLLEGKWRPMVFSIGFGLLLMLAPILVFGPRGALAQTLAYLQVVGSMTDRYTTMLTNQSHRQAAAGGISRARPSYRHQHHKPYSVRVVLWRSGRGGWHAGPALRSIGKANQGNRHGRRGADGSGLVQVQANHRLFFDA